MWRTQTANDMQGPHGIHRSRSLCKLLSLYAQSGRPSKELNIMKFGDSIKKKKPNNSKILQSKTNQYHLRKIGSYLERL